MAQAVDRALDLLLAVVGSSGPVTMTEIAAETGIDKSTAQRLLTSLVDRGLLVRDEARCYDLGPGMFGMAAAVNARSNVRKLAVPHLTELRDMSGETSSLHLRVGDQRVCVEGAESTHPVRRVVPLGESLPLHVGPSGKVILAHLDQASREAIHARAGRTPAECDELERVFVTLREARVLHTESDRMPGIRAVSAPVFGAHGVLASITVAGPADRWSSVAAAVIEAPLLTAACAISSRLGAIR